MADHVQSKCKFCGEVFEKLEMEGHEESCDKQN